MPVPDAIPGAMPGAPAGSRFLSAFGDDAGALAAAAQPAQTLHAGTNLVWEGEASDRLHIVAAGWACRYKTTRDGGRQIVALVVPGDAADLDVLMFGRSDASVRVLTAATVFAIRCDDARALAAHRPGIARTLARLAMTEAAILAQWALCLGRMPALRRLAHLLCELGERLPATHTPAGTGFDLPLTQEQLADALGLTPVHVNRMLQQLRATGLVVRDGRAIRFPHPARLRDLADFDPRYLHAAPAAPPSAA